MLTIALNDRYNYNLPTGWNELNVQQLKDVTLILTNGQPEHIKRQEIIRKLTGMDKRLVKWREFLKPDPFYYVALQFVDVLFPEINYLFDQNQLTNQLLPGVTAWRYGVPHRLYGPAANFMDLTFAEFDDAEYWLDNFKKTANNHALDMLCAIIYRPRKWWSRERVEYNPLDNDHRARLCARLPDAVRLCILFYYTGCRNVLMNDFAELFTANGSGSGSWTDLAHEMAGPVLGSIDEVNRRPVRQVFYEMRRVMQDGGTLAANAQPVL